MEPFESHFGDKATINSIVRKIVDTRNYLTHYDSTAEKRAAKGRKLWILGQKLESIFELNIYKRLSFSEE
ncbi:HEPN domain-containing protein [Pseudomonas sp. 9AZ]|uniref:HEPN domain-containing protein n=1 Tax=Pseudomonas sp. 9AZ TaxID=2653168 RepID=UPI0035566158